MKNSSVKKILEKQTTCAFVPKGVSMWPFIKNKKHTVIIKKPDNPLCVFDVIFYTTCEDREVLHRVIEINGENIITMGDGLIEPERVDIKNVFGVMQGYYVGKKFIDAKDPKYLKKVAKWYSNAKKRRRKIKNYKLRLKIKNKIIRILNKGKEDNV